MAENGCKILLILATLMISLMGIAALSTKDVSKKKPHIILIVADDLGWNDVSWNNPNVVMPYLNELAVNGVRLNQSYVQPTCTPTRAALMSGKYPFTMGLQSGVIKPTEPRGLPIRTKMLPRLLKNIGYSTHAIGKWHLGFCSWDYTPTRRGFDTFYGFYSGAEDYYTHRRATTTKARLMKRIRKRGGQTEYLDLRNNTKPDDSKKGVYSTHLFAKAAEDIVWSRDPKDPMFMYLAFQSVHSPLQVPSNYSRIYRHIGRYERRVYLGMVTAMDEAVGRLIAALKETGHYENSVIIFTTDNGGSIRFGASNWPLRGGKATLWEGGTRSPAFIHSPHLPNPGNITNQLHHVTDWYSTIVAIAGGERYNVDGINQWDALAGISVPPRVKMIYNMDDSKRFKAGVRFKDYKMLVGGMALISWASPPTSEDSQRKRVKPGKDSKGGNSLRSMNSSSSSSLQSDNAPTISGPREEVTNNENRGNFRVMPHNDGLNISVHKSVNRLEDGHEEADIRRMWEYRAGNWKQVDEDYIFWSDLKRNPLLNWEPRVLRILGGYFRSRTKIRLYNLKSDPEERINLSSTEIYRLQEMLNYLSRHLLRYTPVGRRERKSKGHPQHWGNVWSPGWCQSKW